MKTIELAQDIVAKHENNPSAVVMILQDIQEKCNYLPAEALDRVAELLKIPRSQVYSVATFYKSFSLTPRGKNRLDICEGTACHIRGAALLLDQAGEELGITPGETTADGEYTLNAVHCVGACAMGPVAVLNGQFIGEVTPAELQKILRGSKSHVKTEPHPPVEEKTEAPLTSPQIPSIHSIADYRTLRDTLLQKNGREKSRIIVCNGTGCLARGSMDVAAALTRELAENAPAISLNLAVKKVGCHGLCEKGPLVIIFPENIYYTAVTADDAPEIVRETILERKKVERLLYRPGANEEAVSDYREIPFYAGQSRLALRHVGTVDPLDLSDYIRAGGYGALFKAFAEMTPSAVIDEVEKSGLRGRGGGGFSTGKKWRTAAAVDAPRRYVVCNGDEGDPGAFMDCSIMEGAPHNLIEGMIICAYAVGASRGYIYVREEYPRALQHLKQALAQAREANLLGENIGGTEFSFDITINRGAGAFVCGESTALMQSVEGKVGEPRAKYIRSAERGLFGLPTVLNNVETFVNIPQIISEGAAVFASTGSPGNTGTKVFSVVGKVKNTGLVEVPMGTSLRRIIFDLCGGIIDDRPFKAVQTGGPSGGCLPEGLLDLPVDFDSLVARGSMMGSGGMIVMDDTTCMVDVARYFTSFLASESCGKCSPCRFGLAQMQHILERICRGEGVAADLEDLEKLLALLENGSLCGLGRSAANPVRSTLNYFRDEYLAHIEKKKCPAAVCRNLISYHISAECTGCRRCARSCPQKAISGARKEQHHINDQICNRCGLCRALCNFAAITVS